MDVDSLFYIWDVIKGKSPSIYVCTKIRFWFLCFIIYYEIESELNRRLSWSNSAPHSRVLFLKKKPKRVENNVNYADASSAQFSHVFTDKSLGDTASDVISDSSGVGTSQSDTTNNSLSIPGTTVVCVDSYNSGIPGHLSINQGDILEGILLLHRFLFFRIFRCHCEVELSYLDFRC